MNDVETLTVRFYRPKKESAKKANERMKPRMKNLRMKN